MGAGESANPRLDILNGLVVQGRLRSSRITSAMSRKDLDHAESAPSRDVYRDGRGNGIIRGILAPKPRYLLLALIAMLNGITTEITIPLQCR